MCSRTDWFGLGSFDEGDRIFLLSLTIVFCWQKKDNAHFWLMKQLEQRKRDMKVHCIYKKL